MVFAVSPFGWNDDTPAAYELIRLPCELVELCWFLARCPNSCTPDTTCSLLSGASPAGASILRLGDRHATTTLLGLKSLRYQWLGQPHDVTNVIPCLNASLLSAPFVPRKTRKKQQTVGNEYLSV